MSLLHQPQVSKLFACLLLFSLPLLGLCQETAMAEDGEMQKTTQEEQTTLIVIDQDVFAVRPLENLIADALENSPLIKVQALNMDNVSHKIRILEREWTNYIAAIGTAQVGNIRFIDDLQSVNEIDFRTITRENTFYSIGLHFRLPLGDFMTKSDRKALLTNQLKQEELVHADREMRLRELVIRQYHELQLKVKLIEVRSKDLDFHKVSSESAEKYFREGNMTLEEYTNAISLRNKAEAVLEETKMGARLAFQILQETVGKDIRAN